MFLLINSNNLFAQKEFSNWIFGRNAGISFNTPDLKPININGSQLNTWEGCSSVSDKYGKLLFYSDGTKVWNKNNQLMPNGTNLNGYYSASQSCIVVNNIANPNQYYIFTIDGVEQNQNGLSYSILDITLDNGFGDIVSSQKNIQLIDRTVENLCTVRHSNNQDTWVINYSTQQNSFFVFLITKNGVNSIPFKSPGFSTVSSAAGYSIKSSKSGSMVAYANQRTGSVEVYDFDKTNGTLSKKYNIKTPSNWAYAVEFSPNERFLYASVFVPCKVIQYDLNLADETKISQNGYILANNPVTFYYGLIQIAPDGKVYIAKDGSQYLATIDLPDELGSNCNYVEDSFLLTGKSGLGLPNYSISEYYSENPVLKITTNSPICEGEDLLLFADTVANAQYHWYGPNGFTSNQQNPVIKKATVNYSGKYYFYVTVNSKNSDTISIDVIVYAKPSATITVKDKQRLCPGESSILSVSEGLNYSYLWSPTGETTSSIKVKNAGLYSVKVTNQLGCSNTDSVLIKKIPPLNLQSDKPSIDFGELDPCQPSKIDSIKITNIDSEDAIIVSIISTNDAFTLESPLPILTFESGKSISFKVRFSPNSTKTYSGDMVLISECGDTFSFSLKGSKLKSLVEIDRQSINFGISCIENNISIDTIITIYNNGTENAVFQEPVLFVPYKVISPNFPLTLKKSDSIKVTISYSPIAEGYFNSVIKFPFKTGSCPNDTLTIALQSIRFRSELITQTTLIRMPEMLECGFAKDSIITIKNSGNVTDTLYKIDTDNNCKYINPLPLPIEIKSGDSVQITLQWNPVTTDTVTIYIKLYYKPCDKFLEIIIAGRKNKSGLSSLSQLIQMPEMCECDISKDTVITIRNTGNVKDTIFNIETDLHSKYIAPLPLPIIIKPGDSVQITLQWNPMKADSVTSFVKLNYNPCNKIFEFTLAGRKNGVDFLPYDTLKFDDFILCSETAQNKDLIVKNKNCSQETARITDAFVDASIFTAFIPKNDSLPFDGIKSYKISYLPKSLSDTSAILEIHYMPCNITKKIVLKGKVTQPELNISSVDFGKVSQYQYSVKEITLTNNGQTTDTITKLNGINPPLSYEPPVPQFPIIIKSGDSVKVRIRYTPLNDGDDTLSISAEYLPCNLNSTATLTRSAGIFAKTIVYIDTTKANTGDTATLHLILRHSENLISSGIAGFKALFRYNATLLAPLFNSDSDTIINEERIMQIAGNIPINFSSDNFILKEMKFIAGLGNSECTVMKLDTVIWLGGPYKVEKEDGRFCLNNICVDGGKRLINPKGKIAISSVKPNPAEDNIKVELELVEKSGYILSIINTNGQTIREIIKSNIITGLTYEKIDISDLASGVYNLILQTESERISKLFLIMK
jgi:hypothetical protein